MAVIVYTERRTDWEWRCRTCKTRGTARTLPQAKADAPGHKCKPLPKRK